MVLKCTVITEKRQEKGRELEHKTAGTNGKQAAVKAYEDTMMAGNSVLWFSGCLACPRPWLHTQALPTKRNSRNPRNTYKYHHIISNKTDKIIFPTAFVKTTKEQH